MKYIGMLLLCCWLSGCTTHTFILSNKTSVLADEQTQHYFLSGIQQEQQTKAADICGGIQRTVKVETKFTLLDILFAGASLGLYTPMHSFVYCLN